MYLIMPNPTKSANGVYYLRVRIPHDLRKVGGPSHVKRSLGTKDKAEAKTLFAKVHAQLLREWEAQRSGPQPLSHRELVALAGLVYRDIMATAADEPGPASMWDDLIRIGEGAIKDPAAAERWYGPSADTVVKQEGVVLTPHDRSRLIGETHRVTMLAAEQKKRRSNGDYGPDPNLSRFPERENAKGTTGAKIVTLTELFELWEREHLADGKAPATPRDHRQKLDSFIKWLGHEDASKVTSKNISDWCDWLRHDQGLGGKTVANKYLSAVRAVFRTGAAKFVISDNPAEAVRRKAPKKSSERPKGFTDDEANQILSAALRAETSNGRAPELTKLACRWLPWLCAYTGARGGEIAQLRGSDFFEEHGILTVRITPEAGTVKTDEYRYVPVHSHLIEQGILDMVRKRGQGPLFYEPNNNKREANSTQWGNVRAKVGEWVRKTAGVTDRRVQPNHAWRHRFKTVCRDVGIERGYMDAIQGHEDGTASSDYGEHTMKALGREIERLPRYLSSPKSR